MACKYRPVSLTCIASKVLESIVREAIIDHMVDWSTVLQLLQVL